MNRQRACESHGTGVRFFQCRDPVLIPPQEWTECGGRLAALEDLACVTPSLIGNRGETNFVDVYFPGHRNGPQSAPVAMVATSTPTLDLGLGSVTATLVKPNEENPT